MTTTNIFEDIVATLRGLDIPIRLTKESGPYKPGINLWRMTRADVPSTTYPYHGTLVTVMYVPQSESDDRHDEWARRVREVLVSAYPDRYRPLAFFIGRDSASVLIEDPNTPYAKWRAAENAKRVSLGWKPLHEIGQ